MILRRSQHRGFTLAEVMISVAMMLIILLGINRIFQMTGDTVSAGLAVSDSLRTTRGLRDMLHHDFVGSEESSGLVAASETPFLAIRCQDVFAFLNRADRLSDLDGNAATCDLNGNGTEGESSIPGENVSTAAGRRIYNHRHHRVDTLAFFSRGQFQRQTGHGLSADPAFQVDFTSNEAWVWYGHLMLPGKLPSPVTTPPQHYIAGGFLPPGGVGMGSTANSESTNPNNYYAQSWILGRVAMLLQPEDVIRARSVTAASPLNTARVTYIQRPAGAASSSLAPLQQGSLAATYTSGGAAISSDVIEQSFYDLAGTSIAEFRQITRIAAAPAGSTWWRPLVLYNNNLNYSYRFSCNPFIQKPITNDVEGPRKLAQAIPALAAGCTKFIVEFAGDYCAQNASTGAIINNNPDDIVDFDIIGGVARTRWYGLPRDIDGDGVLDVDVVPGSFSFERETDLSNYRYTCVWGPDDLNPINRRSLKPALIRITVQVSDPRGRLGEGLPQEYIFKVR